MSIDEFIAELELAIEGMGPGTIRPGTVLRDLPGWDSLAVLATLACVDAGFGVQLSAVELAECRTVQEIFDRARSKRA